MPRQENTNVIADALALVNTGAVVRSVIGAAGTVSVVNPGGNNPWVFELHASPTLSAQGGLNPSSGGFPLVLTLGSQTAINVPGSNSPAFSPDGATPFPAVDGSPFQVVISGKVQPNKFGKTLRLYLYLVQGAFSDSFTQSKFNYGPPIQIFGLSATLPVQASLCANSNFFFILDCMWDSQSLVLTGSYQGNFVGTLVSPTGFSIAHVRFPMFGLGANLPATASGTDDIVTLSQLYAVGNANIDLSD